MTELRAAIEHAHAQAQRALRGDADADLTGSQLAWAKTALADAPLADALTATTGVQGSKSGAIAGFGKFEEFDPGWLETLAEVLEHLLVKPPEFGVDPRVVPIPARCSLGVAGDWATGYWAGANTPAARVARLVANEDYAIHLGDTYYAGTRAQVADHLAAKWPAGKRGCFAIPGNHEMYTKGWPLRDALASRCPLQGGATFFALQSDAWLVLALDTAYFAPGMYLDGTLGPTSYRRGWLRRARANEQRVFANELLAKRGARRTMLFTHHPPYDLGGPSARQRGLRAEVLALFGAHGLPRGPDYWAWGHIHAVAAYTDEPGAFRGRLVGHGGIPFARAETLASSPSVAFYESESAGEPDSPRVLNGYLRLELDGARVRESLIGENGTLRWQSEL